MLFRLYSTHSVKDSDYAGHPDKSFARGSVYSRPVIRCKSRVWARIYMASHKLIIIGELCWCQLLVNAVSGGLDVFVSPVQSTSLQRLVTPITKLSFVWFCSISIPLIHANIQESTKKPRSCMQFTKKKKKKIVYKSHKNQCQQVMWELVLVTQQSVSGRHYKSHTLNMLCWHCTMYTYLLLGTSNWAFQQILNLNCWSNQIE